MRIWGGAAALILSAGAAAAEEPGPEPLGVDWSVQGSVNQTVEVIDNQPLSSPSGGTIYGSTTRVGATISARTKRALMQLRGTVVGALFDGGDDADQLDRIDPDIAAIYSYIGKDVQVDASATFDVQPTSVTQVEDTGLTDIDATQFSGAASVNVAWRASPTTTISTGVGASFIDFSRSVAAFSPTRSVSVNAGLTERINAVTSASLSASYRYFESDNATDTTSHAVRLSAGITHQRTRRHTISLQAGATGVQRNTNALGNDGFDLGFNGSARLTYSHKDWSANLGLSQNVDASASGELQSFSRLAGGVSYQVNARQQIGLSATGTRRSDLDFGGDSTVFFSVGPSYAYSLAENTVLSLGYQYRLRDRSTESSASGHRLFLTLAHNFTALP